MLAELHTDFPERFAERKTLWGLAANGDRRELHLEEHWLHKGGVVLKFAGVDSINDAEQLKALEIQLPGEERAELEDGASYVSDLVGCQVWVGPPDSPELLGTVSDVQFGAGEAPLLVVRRADGREVDLPYAAEFVKRQDVKERRIQMQLPQGLLDLDAPLSTDEKQRQESEAGEARSAGERRKRR